MARMASVTVRTPSAIQNRNISGFNGVCPGVYGNLLAFQYPSLAPAQG